MWQFAAEQLGKDAALDAGVPKKNGELLVTGSVYTPGGQPAETCPAFVRLGELEKTVYVIGDRFWKPNLLSGPTQTKPVPFTSMPLTWERAFGGEGFPENPAGRGFAPTASAHGPVQLLPNIELPGKLVREPGDRPPPAGLGPVDLTRPQRLSKAGTYDAAWLEELFPGLAADIDWTFWNIAPADQQRQGHWRGDEAFELRNLHPREPKLQGALPGLRARVFVTRLDADGAAVFQEIPSPLTTVWFFPHAEKAILVHQGAIETREDDATDVTLLMLAADKLAEPRDLRHYEEVLALRLDKERGVFHVLRDDQLLPPDLLSSFQTKDEVEKMKEHVTRDGVLEQRSEQRMRRLIDEGRAVIASYGLDPDLHGPSQPEPMKIPELSELPDLVARLEAEALEHKAENERATEQKLTEVEAMMEAHGIDPSFLRAELSQQPSGPPNFTAEAELERIKGLDAQSRAMGVVLDELTEWIADTELHARWKQAEQAQRDAYLLSAHYQGEAPRLAGDEARRVRDQTLAALHAGEAFAYRDLTGADLSGLDLRGANFRQAWLESVDLTGSNLEGADFSEAVLARADLSGVSLSGAVFRGANLGGARLVGVRGGAELDLTEAILTKADLRRADLGGARLDAANLSEAVFEETVLDRIQAKGLHFFRTDLSGVSLAGARLEQVTFIDCAVGGLDLSDSVLEGVTFLQGRAAGIRLARATTKKLVFCLVETLEGAHFEGARLEGANLRGMMLRRADFSEAILEGADLSECDLSEANLHRVVARGARFSKAKLREANLTAANLMRADLTKTDIRGACFLGANLHGSSFAKARSDTDTVLTEALQTRVTIHPVWRRA